MGSSCVNLSRAVLPGFGGARRRGLLLLPLLSSSRQRQRHAGGAVVARCSSSSTTAGSSSSRPSSSYLTAHGDNHQPGAAGGGIGVAEFLGAKNLLITGGTGFLAKVLIEKILRTNPDVGKIYVLIKAKDGEAALRRLQNEVVDTELFKCLQEIHGEGYDTFIATKLVPVVGDVREPNVGITPDIADEIADQVDVIINSAANTTFDERYDVAMDINTMGPFRIMSFAQRFRRLKLFLQVSTAYVNGQRQGLVLEKPFRMGDTIAKELGSSSSSSGSSEQGHNKTIPVLDIEAEIKLAFYSRRHPDDSPSFAQEMKDLGLERAKLHGWQDTYVFTKAMGEMVINSMRGEIPVVTIRPSVIESTWRDPFPGWMEGNRMMDPVVLYYGKGQLSGFLADPDGVLDVVPADMVVNATLASMAKHGGGGGGAGMHVYHVSSSTVNPLVFGDLSRFLFQHFTRCPYSDAAGQPILVPPMRLFDTMEQFASYVETDTLLRSVRSSPSQRARDLCARSVEQTVYLGSIYHPYTFYGGRFDNGNTEALFAAMSPAERARFHFDVRSVDWTDYITNVHIPGLRKHVMKGRGVAANQLLASTSV